MSQYSEELYCDTAGLESAVGSKCIAIGKNCIVRVCSSWKNCIAIGDCIATLGCSGSWCIAIGRLDGWGKFVSQYTKCIVTGEEVPG